MSPTLDPARYAAAERLLRHRRGELVTGATVRPSWVDGSRFWFRSTAPGGDRFVLVDPHAGTRRDVFDTVRLAKALGAELDVELDPGSLPITGLRLDEQGTIGLDACGFAWTLDLDTYAVRRGAALVANPFEMPSPDGGQVVLRRGHDLWVRDTDGAERRLTDDGAPDADYGANPDYVMYSTLLAKLGMPCMPPALAWSPDGTRVLTHRTLQDGLRTVAFVDPGAPGDPGPSVLTQRAAVAGDERVPLAEYVVLDVAAGAVVRAELEPVPMPVMSALLQGWAWWAADSSAVFVLARGRDARELTLWRIDAATGKSTALVTERGATRVEPAQGEFQRAVVRVSPVDGSVLWFSQRDGYGHLYHYGPDGELRNQVTSGPWVVQAILHVDEAVGVVRFTASGMLPDAPARRTVCSVRLDGTGLHRITEDDLDHDVTVAPDGSYFLTTASTNELAPVVTARGWDASVLVEVERADDTGLRAAGWRPPEPVRTRSADGTTDVHGLLYLPHDFDPAQRYPVVDTPAGLPGAARVQPGFDAGHAGAEAEVLAALGFAVLALDGRGAPGRDKAFHDASYGNLRDACGLDDHAAAIRELAATRPWMDLERVGAVGASGGGFAAVRALIDHGDLYRVAVAESGMHDLRHVNAGLAEPYQGPLDTAGSVAGYAATSSVEQAHRITGRLLVVHGGLDDRVPAYLSLRLVEAMVAADRDVELLLVPRADHILLGYEHHVTRRRWDFLVQHLLGVTPPSYRLAPRPLDPAMLAELFG